MNIEAQRRLVVQEALSWQFTPFHWHAQSKGSGGGCDCGSLLKASYDRVGTNVELPRPGGKPYTTQFFLHGTEEVYLKALANYCYAGHQFRQPPPALRGGFVEFCSLCGLKEPSHLLEYRNPLPGDIVVFKMGKAYGHAGIVVNWPLIVHSCARDGYVSQAHADSHPDLQGRDRLYFSLKVWHPDRR